MRNSPVSLKAMPGQITDLDPRSAANPLRAFEIPMP